MSVVKKNQKTLTTFLKVYVRQNNTSFASVNSELDLSSEISTSEHLDLSLQKSVVDLSCDEEVESLDLSCSGDLNSGDLTPSPAIASAIASVQPYIYRPLYRAGMWAPLDEVFAPDCADYVVRVWQQMRKEGKLWMHEVEEGKKEVEEGKKAKNTSSARKGEKSAPAKTSSSSRKPVPKSPSCLKSKKVTLEQDPVLVVRNGGVRLLMYQY